MKSFIKLLLQFCIPFIVLVLIYIVLDPFKVVWHYDSFFDPEKQGRVGLNKDYVSTATFDTYHEQQQYNSFIFGNSRSVFYEVAQWQQHLPPGSKPYHFDASGEALYSLAKKVEYADAKGLELQNVLLILDYETLLQDTPKTGHLFEISPQLVNYRNITDFHFSAMRAFLSSKFLVAYTDFKITGEVKPYMTKRLLIEDSPYTYDPLTNEIRHGEYERMIENGTYYTPERLSVFYEREPGQRYSPPAIGDSQKKILSEIAAVFKRNNTIVKIVINPLYNQEKLNTSDLEYLKQKFGSGNVFDYSGINHITSDYRNYYEASHYRPHIANAIMKEIYGK